MADGMRPDLFYAFVRELAAGCNKIIFLYYFKIKYMVQIIF